MEYFSSLLTSIGGRLFAIGLDLHASSDAGVGFPARQIGNVNESVIERSLDVADAEDVLRVLAWRRGGWSVVDDLLLLLDLLTLLSSLGL